MIKKCIKVPFVEEVTGKSGAQVVFVDTTTESLESTVQDAVDRLMVIGNAQLVKQNFVGLFRSMVAGVMRDGKPRKVEGFLRVYPVFYGAVDLDKGFDPKENGVYLAVELLSEMKLDTSNWTFEDVTEGRKPITIESIKGDDFGIVCPNDGCGINGHGLSGSHKVELKLEGEDAITAEPKYVTGDIARMDISKKAFAPFAYLDNDGKELTVTIRGNYAKATKTVKLACRPKPPLAFTKVYSTALGEEGKWKSFRDTLECTLNDDIPEDAIICHRLVEIATGREVTRVKLSSKNVVTKLDDEKFSLRVTENNSDETDGTWCNAELYRPEVIVESASRGTITAPVVAVVDVA